MITVKLLNQYGYVADNGALLQSYSETPSSASGLTFGTSANDTISAEGGSDFVWSGLGNDTIYGGVGNDTLVGGKGSDFLAGEAGSDTYSLSLGDGIDTIYNYDTVAGNVDTVSFSDVKSTDVRWVQRMANNDLVIGYGTSDQLRVQRFFDDNAGGAAFRVDQLVFSDNVSWNAVDLVKKSVHYGSSGNDTLSSYTGSSNTIFAQDGNDSVSGASYADSLDGGLGDDTIYGGDGSDTLVGGVGSDRLEGSTGNDIYAFCAGDGADVVYDYDTTAGNTDVISFTNLKSTDITSVARVSSSDLVLRYGVSDSVTVSNFFASSSYQVEKFAFSDGVTWSVSAINAIMSNGLTKLPSGGSSWTGQTTADFVFGSTSADSMAGLDGDDWLHGDGGNDTLRGGEGADYLVGGLGSDALYGDAGADTYVYAKGDGFDVIYGQRTEDTLRMKGFKSTDVTFNRQFSDIYVADASSGSSYNIVGLVRQADDGTHEYTGVSQIIFDDKALTADDIRKAALQGTAGNDSNLRGYASNDTISGFDGSDSLYGEGGDDKLYGGLGSDLLDGGIGNDYLDGNKGNDTYRFSLGGGNDTIFDADSSVGNADVLDFQPGIAHDQLWFSQSGNNLVIKVIGTNDSVMIAGGAGASATYHVEQIKAGGKTLSDTQVANLIQAMASMTPPPMGQTTLTDAQRAQLAPVLAANWS